MTQTKPAPSSGESRLKRYFGNPNRLKTHARCWTHVIVFSVELVTTRNPLVLFHFGCNVAWQFCTLSLAIERAGYLGDLATIMPTGVAILAELVPRAGRAEMVSRAVALTLGCSVAVALQGVGLPNLVTQGVGFAAVLDAHRTAAPMLGVDAAAAIDDALRIFLVGVACFLCSKIGTARDIAFLGDLNDAMRARHSGTRFGVLLDFFGMYDVWHVCCMLATLRVGPSRWAARQARP